MVPDLRAFLDILRREGELVEIEAPVDPYLEIAEVHKRVIAAGGPALLFRNPKGSDFPVVTNLFGTLRRVELAFGRRPLEFIQQAARLPMELVPPTFGKLWDRRDFFWQATKLGMTQSAGGPVTQVVEDPQLTRIPMLHCHADDGGAFVTLPLVYTEHPEHGGHNLGMYRVQRHDDATTGIHWQIGKGGGFHHHVAEQHDQALPVTVFVGGPPALILSAIAPLPENVPELLLTSLLLGSKLPRCNNPAGPHPLISGAEFALVGKVPPHVRRPEGPFGDHYGYYSLQHDYPIIQVDKVCRRKDAIWPATVVAKPRQEDYYIGEYLQELLSPLFPVVMPGVRDIWSYGETGFHSLGAAVVQDRFGREAMQHAFRILGEGQLSLTKFLLVTDHPQDLKDFRSLLAHVLARFRPETDLYVFGRLSMDTLDYTGPEVNKGSRGVMLGVGDAVRDCPQAFRGALPAGITQAEAFCAGCLLVSGPSHSDEPGLSARLVDAFPDWPLVVLVDDAARVAATAPRFLWTVFTRFEPAADISAKHRVVHNHIVYEGTVFIDARMKAHYPGELFCDPQTKSTVTDRWTEYFPAGGVEMGDGDWEGVDLPGA
ncbi:MAG: UbiD family decarboxylase [Alphaproteobacteria bacterium]|nr:UbiD family decarboxylase [Alphaproteobacteria bacterium]